MKVVSWFDRISKPGQSRPKEDNQPARDRSGIRGVFTGLRRRRGFRLKLIHVIMLSIGSIVLVTSLAMGWAQWSVSHKIANHLLARNVEIVFNHLESRIVPPARRSGYVNLPISDAARATRESSRLNDVVTSHSEQISGVAFILNTAGAVIAHPNFREPSSEITSGTVPSMPLTELKDPALKALWSALNDTDEQQPDGSTRTREISTSFNGVGYIGYFRTTDAGPAGPWILGTWFLESDAFPYRSLIETGIYVAVAAVFVSIFLAFLIARRLVAPVEELVTATRRVANLDIDNPGALPSSKVKELGDLSGSFARMVQAFQPFKTYVPRKLVHQLIAQGSGQLESRESEITVMFTDIVGFTSLADGRAPTEVAALLNEHFSLIGEIVERNDGTIDKYIGDSLMAFWGAPEQIENSSQSACQAAAEIASALERYNAKRQKAGKDPVRIRIGIHTGSAVIGNIGVTGRVNYTIVGDTVNAAQRIEALASDVISQGSATILISETVARDLPASFDYIEVGTAALKGLKSGIFVYRLKT